MCFLALCNIIVILNTSKYFFGVCILIGNNSFKINYIIFIIKVFIITSIVLDIYIYI